MKPIFETLPMPDGMALDVSPDYRIEEKLDGRFSTQPIAGGLTLLGEAMPSGFHAFDVRGHELERSTLRERLDVLDSIPGLLRPAVAHCAGFMAGVLARGGEGIVVKPLDGLPDATWFKCKRVAVYYGVVRDLNHARGSVRFDLLHRSCLDTPSFEPSNFETGDDGGWVTLGHRFEAVKIGSVLKLEAFGQTASGKLREARLDKDFPGSWLIRG